MAKFMGFSNTEIGLIMSTFGIAAIILYAPSGVIADKFSHRKMITSAMIITGCSVFNGNLSTAVGHALHSGRLCYHHDSDAVVGVN
jgi:MFS family permease